MKEKNKEVGFSRRNFLQGSATLCAGLSLSQFNLFGLTGALSPEDPGWTPTADITSPRTFHHNVCARNCPDSCGLICEIVDGKIVRIVGNPTDPITAGTPCVKGHTHINVVYHPDRILYPMKRVGKKGEGKWQRISSDEAYGIVAAKFKEIIDNYGGEAIAPYSFSGVFGLVQQWGAPWRLFNKMGASQIDREVCAWAGMEALVHTYGTSSDKDMEDAAKAKLIVQWGAHDGCTTMHGIKFINQARDNGAKLVVINPHRTPLASQADMWIQPRPGTDGALALGVAKILIDENLYDKSFIEKYTIGFDKLKETVQNYPLQKVSKITDVPESQILELARMYGKTKQSVIRLGAGMQRRKNGGTLFRAIALLPAITGAVDTEGGGFNYTVTDIWGAMDWDYMNRPDLLAGRKVRDINMNEVGRALLGEMPETKDKPIKGLMVFSGNPMPSGTNVNKTREGLMREDLFTVVHEMFMTDTAEYADIILPAAHFLETEDLHARWGARYFLLNKPAIKPMGEGKSNLQMSNEIARRMGYTEDCFKENEEEFIRRSLNTKNPLYKDLTYESLRDNPWTRGKHISLAEHKFATPSGKIEFYSEDMAKKGFHPVAEYVPDKESIEASPELYAKYPLHLLTPASAQLLTSQWHNVPYIQQVLVEPSVTINKVDADSRGIKHGDFVYVFNDRGKIKLKANVTAGGVKPGVVMSYKCYWDKYTGGNTVNRLTLDENADMNGGATLSTNLVQIAKA